MILTDGITFFKVLSCEGTKISARRLWDKTLEEIGYSSSYRIPDEEGERDLVEIKKINDSTFKFNNDHLKVWDGIPLQY
jgi:hypothetical protein